MSQPNPYQSSRLFIFSDACPSDWLGDGNDDVWHTIVNVLFIAEREDHHASAINSSHIDVLDRNERYGKFISSIERGLRGKLRKWRTGPSYKSRFCHAFNAIEDRAIEVAACSFQEGTLRANKPALLHSYNTLIGGIEGRGIGFEEFVDARGRRRMKHSFVNLNGYHEISGLENQMLVLLFMAWFVTDQFRFYRKALGFPPHLGLTVVSDNLSGDDDQRSRNETMLRNLVDPEQLNAPIVLTRSPRDTHFSGDFLADNLAGWLNAAIQDLESEHARLALESPIAWDGWHLLIQSETSLKSTPATNLLKRSQWVR